MDKENPGLECTIPNLMNVRRLAVPALAVALTTLIPACRQPTGEAIVARAACP